MESREETCLSPSFTSASHPLTGSEAGGCAPHRGLPPVCIIQRTWRNLGCLKLVSSQRETCEQWCCSCIIWAMDSLRWVTSPVVRRSKSGSWENDLSCWLHYSWSQETGPCLWSEEEYTLGNLLKAKVTMLVKIMSFFFFYDLKTQMFQQGYHTQWWRWVLAGGALEDGQGLQGPALLLLHAFVGHVCKQRDPDLSLESEFRSKYSSGRGSSMPNSKDCYVASLVHFRDFMEPLMAIT